MHRYAGVAQLEALLPSKQNAAGSNPVTGSKTQSNSKGTVPAQGELKP